MRGNHGMTHSAYIADPDGYGIEVLYDLPEEVWSGDVDAALNYFEYLPPEKELEDTTDYQRFGPNEAEPWSCLVASSLANSAPSRHDGSADRARSS